MEENNCIVKEPSYPCLTILTDRNKVTPEIITIPKQIGNSGWVSNKRIILVVDDEKFNCDIIYGFLLILGVKNRAAITEFAYNGEEALSRV